MILEFGYWKAALSSLAKSKIPIIPYVPERRQAPARLLPVDSAWKGIESVLGDLICRFQIGTDRCLEFGVEYGYSTVVLSSFFSSVIGVDTFTGDQYTVNKENIYLETVKRLAPFENVRLVQSDYRDWIKRDMNSYDLIHVDIVHTYADTYACGLWSAFHSRCTIFHDTESFPAVKRAVIEISRRTGKSFHNFNESFGLGILV
jgi:Methyltransferase domain